MWSVGAGVGAPSSLVVGVVGFVVTPLLPPLPLEGVASVGREGVVTLGVDVEGVG